MDVISIKYGDSVLDESQIFKNGDKEKLSHISFIIYLIKSGEKNILVDAGCKTMPGFKMENFVGSVDALKNTGISPDDITDIIITHAHHDHIECVNEFKNALIHIQKDEYEKGKKYIDSNHKINLFDCEYYINDMVRVLKIGGHSKGSCIVEIYDMNRCIVIVGDECYSHKCISEQIPTGCSVCYEKSAKFIKKYSNGKYKLLFCHDEAILGD